MEVGVGGGGGNLTDYKVSGPHKLFQMIDNI